MPIYEYRCDGCGFEFEDMQKITDSPIEVCPTCGEPQAHRLISRTNFVLRGTGWYVTDYGKGSGGQAGEQKPPKKKSESKDSTKKAETKTSSTDSSSKKDD